MFVNVISDLHLNFADASLPGGDVLVLAGDVFEAGYIRSAENAGKHQVMLDRYKRFMDEELVKYDQVLYVFGNHEYYAHDYTSARARIQKYLPSNVTVLENNYVKLDGVLFWGACMWTDFRGGDPLVMHDCEEVMSDFSVIKHNPSRQVTRGKATWWTTKFSVHDALDAHRYSRARLEEFLSMYTRHKTVVITHHAPSHMSIDQQYLEDTNNLVNYAYYTDLSNLILDNPQICLWAHGHVHTGNDYEIGSCRVISNPRGYVGYELQPNRWEVMKHLPVEI